MEDSRYLISKLTTKFTVTNTLWCWLKGRQIDQWNGIASLEIDMQLYGQLIFTHIKVIQWRKRSSFNKGTGTTGYSKVLDIHMEKNLTSNVSLTVLKNYFKKDDRSKHKSYYRVLEIFHIF